MSDSDEILLLRMETMIERAVARHMAAMPDSIREAALDAYMERRLLEYPEEDALTEAEAFRRYGRANVKGWDALGYLTVTRGGEKANSPKCYSKRELDRLYAMKYGESKKRLKEATRKKGR